MDNNLKLYKNTKIFPEIIELVIPEYISHSKVDKSYTLSFIKIKCEDLYLQFIETLISKIGNEYFPVVRLSDGEYKFLLGNINPFFYKKSYFKAFIYFIYNYFNSNRDFVAKTKGIYSSGKYKKAEVDSTKEIIKNQIKKISENGILALHLTFGKKTFQEYYHYPLYMWLIKNKINIDANNYYPFYFIYAFLRSKFAYKIFQNKNILIIHSAINNKKNNIIKTLNEYKPKKIQWHNISVNRSLFDKIEIRNEYYDCDLILVGAGIGKFNIISQLEILNRPCIDAGFIFEVWSNNDNKWKRAYVVNDEEWDDNKIQFK